ncbi:hypothetical protein [Pontibacillus litoralis]|uniref:Uncharacterized protein n=1 Tax=Pontibacillus litoralis JSM 072002 TaxID=1385512 RepID=A0A0A5G2A1_9BACI|nr:hypothetical protein [Pontibacillus litoralis]KGX85215.1 hypothetical protein N784_09975 [Pontibacillus litoralis JSM 072002]
MNTKEIELKSGAHFNRTVGGIVTNSLDAVDVAVQNGCAIQDVRYTLRYPEIMICDLSNPEYPLNLCDGETIYNCFIMIEKTLSDYIKNTNIKRITGDSLKTEIAITGPIKQELWQVKNAILQRVYECLDIKSKMYLSLYEARGIHQIRNINNSNDIVKEFYQQFIAKYSEYIKQEAKPQIKLFNQSTIYQNHLLWNKIKGLAKNKLFILTAGLSIALGYMNSTMDKRIFFTEVHRENDPYQLYRKKNFHTIFPENICEEAQHDSIVIIDKIYTGGSLLIAEDLVVGKRSNTSPKILKVGLFPKSYHSLHNVDYVVYAGRLIKSTYILENYTSEDWHFGLLLEPSTEMRIHI